jgi:S-adenosylhomocysteine hydrolase/8-oxo-dGTP pyrophosphatase MutT (NUDIX family)
MRNEILEIVDSYKNIYTEESNELNQVIDFVKNSTNPQITDRRNYIGHLTASCLIIDSTRSEILLLEHIVLEKWLQPGGHFQTGDKTLIETALREAEEETGINKKDLLHISVHQSSTVPLDIDSHPIPENESKNEEAHFHHDFRYLFLYTGHEDIRLNPDESVGYKWVKFTELSEKVSFVKLVEKIRHFLSFEYRTKQFYDAIIKKVKTPEKYNSIVISHIIPDCIFYLKAVNKVFPIISLIPKPKSIDDEIYQRVKVDFPIIHMTREEIDSAKNSLIDIINKSEKKIIIFDIGGYFSNIQESWPKEVLEKIVLIIEDTENGHQKYENVGTQIPIFSAARSPLKDNEDFLVGQSVLFSADAILRAGGTLIQYMKCSVFGYGKIGYSIAYHLLQRGMKPNVYDINPIKRIEAYNHLCSIPSRDEIIKNSDIIFSATGNKSLDIKDFRKLKDGCFIFSVTSSDDEMELNFIKGEYEYSEVKKNIFKCSNNNNFFFLVNHGNAVNFLHNAVMGNFIHLVRSEMILAINENIKDQHNQILTISTETRNEIATIWLNIFDPENRQLSNIEYMQ